jgi:hypothetical protein
MTPREYWTACRLHDWHYMYSDDPGVYRAGKESLDRLQLLAHNDPALANIFRQWEENQMNCGPVPREPKLED